MNEDDLIPLSALQHYLYCSRQCALIHIERVWIESQYTAEGRLLHERADVPASEQCHGIRTVRALPLVNRALGIVGVADVVEFHDVNGAALPMPVEYKRGRPKRHRADEVQLCAQGLCLEEMFGVAVNAGAIFYGLTRRRLSVPFDATLRALTKQCIEATRRLIDAGQTPSARYEARRCDLCSLLEACQPRLLGRALPVNAWLARALEE